MHESKQGTCLSLSVAWFCVDHIAYLTMAVDPDKSVASMIVDARASIEAERKRYLEELQHPEQPSAPVLMTSGQ